MPEKVVVNLSSGPERPDAVTMAFLVADSALSSGKELVVFLSLEAVRLAIPGDANLDKTVDIGDFALLAANFNTPSYWGKGDFNYDGMTELGDFALLAVNFNQTLPAAVPRSAVPEPCGLLLALPAFRRRAMRR